MHDDRAALHHRFGLSVAKVQQVGFVGNERFVEIGDLAVDGEMMVPRIGMTPWAHSPSHARAAASRAEGASPRARGPPVDYRDKLPPTPVVNFYAAAPVHNPAAVDIEGRLPTIRPAMCSLRL